MSAYSVFVLLLLVGFVQSWHDERNWATVHGGELDSGSSESELVTFRNHPLKNGQKVRSYAALYLEANRNLVFGQAGRSSSKGFCSKYNVLGFQKRICTGYRILKNSPDSNQFLLIKPSNFDPNHYNPVEYENNNCVMIYDGETNSSFFGTLIGLNSEEPVVYGIDYNRVPIEIRGKGAIEDNVLLVVEQR